MIPPEPLDPIGVHSASNRKSGAWRPVFSVGHVNVLVWRVSLSVGRVLLAIVGGDSRHENQFAGGALRIYEDN